MFADLLSQPVRFEAEAFIATTSSTKRISPKP